jgi:hypothetical protein
MSADFAQGRQSKPVVPDNEGGPPIVGRVLEIVLEQAPDLEAV